MTASMKVTSGGPDETSNALRVAAAAEVWPEASLRQLNLPQAIPGLLRDLESRIDACGHDYDPDARPLALSVDAVHLRDLYNRLDSQPCIDQAKGVISGAYRIPVESAFAVLTRWSQQSNLKIRVIAQALVEAYPTSQLNPAELFESLLPQLRSRPTRVDTNS